MIFTPYPLRRSRVWRSGPARRKHPGRIHMSNAAGLFQIDALLREKLKGSGLEPYVEVFADVAGEADKRLFATHEF